MGPYEKLTVQVTKTSDGLSDYLQVLSEDQFALNIVLIAQKIEVRDQRDVSPPRPASPSPKRKNAKP